MIKIHVGFSRPKKSLPGAVAISKWMNRPYSHVYVGIEFKGVSLVFHATGKMLHFLHSDRFHSVNTTVKKYELNLTPKQSSVIFLRCVELAGVKYGFIELAKIVIADTVFALTGKSITFSDSKGYICSELVAEIVATLGIKFDKPLHLIKPSDVDKALEDNRG